jgi:hypothetical protein
MRRRPNEEQLEELHRLHEETVTIVSWVEKHQGFSHAGPIRALADEALKNLSLARMRAIARELRGIIGSLPLSLCREIFDGLGSTAVPLAVDLEIDADTARAIVARGRIASEAEYYAVRHYLGRLDAESKASDVERRRVLELLEGYGDDGAPAAT